jgi:hypothetical protein
VLVLGVVAALLVVLVVRTDDPSEPNPDPDGEEALLPQPVALTPLGPRDGKASIGLPVTVEPAAGLDNGSRVTATGSGFEPGEQVAIVQCALEAGRPAKGGEAAGVDGCDIGFVTYTDASSDGVATGTYSVRASITTPATGTVDCTTEPSRCILAMAAMADYDRSGAGGLTFGDAPLPDPRVPNLTVDPSTGLADAQVVRVEATGLPPSTAVRLEVCAVDPAGCWATGPIGGSAVDLTTDGHGALSVDVPVWRYLPGPEPHTYIDCAVSVCDLLVTTGTPGADPAPAHLAFTPGGDGPVGAALTLEPSEDVPPGSPVIVRGAGFDPSATVMLSLCITGQADDERGGICVDLAEAVRPDADGMLEVTVDVPGVEALGGDRLAEPSSTTTVTEAALQGHPCDGESTHCVVLAVLSYGTGGEPAFRPRFGPDPVPITYARSG